LTLALLDRQTRRELLIEAVEPVLAAYGLDGASVRLLEQKTNITFRVDAGGERFLLRVCQAGVYGRQELASEGMWLRALRESGLVVPELVDALDGSPVSSVLLPGNAEPRWCVLLRWVPGEIVESAVDPALIEQVGELGARIHNVSESFVPPPGFSRPRWDCDRLFGRGEVIPAGRGEPLITARTREVLDAAAALLRQDMAALGETPDVWGLVHKDLEPDNTVFHEGRVHAIDFADCGWGHYLYDVAASLLPLREKKGYPELREAFLRGYRRHRPLRPEHEALIDAFLIARSLFTIRFMVLTSLDERPELQSYAERVIPMMVGEVRRFVEKRTGAGRKASVVQLLSGLRDRGVKIWAEGEKLRFTAPQGALTPELKAELAERKAEILAFLRQGQAPAPAAGPVPRARPEGDPVPLSFAQQRLWFLDQLHPGSAEYNVTRAVRLSGRLRVDVLGRAANEVIRRHSVLRTTFGTVDGVPVQLVAPSLALPLPVVDLRALPEEDRLAEARSLVDREGRRPFDLSTGPLLRLNLLRLEDGEHLVASTMHHIVSDGWSTGLLFREMGLLYEAFLSGRPSPLPELPIQYADFALWQREHLDGEALAGQLAWWKQHFDGAPDSLDLPTDHPRSEIRGEVASRSPFLLPKGPAEALRAMAQAEGATLFMVLFAAWSALLARASGQEDVVLGVPIANRNRTEIEGLIGFFVNTLALRTDLSGDPSWNELLGRVRRATVGAYAHQDLPFERLVEELRPERALAANPLFQVMFALQAAQREESFSLPGLTMSPSPLGSSGGPAKFDLTLSLTDSPEGVYGALEYRPELFDAPTMVRLLDHFQVLLEGIAAEPGRRLSQLPLLTARERQQLLVEWNDGGVVPREPRVLTDLLARTPEAVALVCGEERVSYAELERLSDRLAHALRRLGVGPERIVALHLERSVELVVAMLATLKAGGAYLPLDPALPSERRAFVLEDSKARVVLTRDPAAVNTDEAVLSLEPGWADRLPEPEGPLPDDLLPAHPAYVLYTSGSTGQPKGVVLSQAGLVNHMLWMQESLPLTPEDRVLQKTPAHFDASVWEFWAPLLAGAQMVLARPEGHRDPAYLVAALREHGITVLQVVPTLLRALLEQEGFARCRTLRRLCVGGEALTAELRDGFFALGLDAELVNLYGPTETTIEAVWARVRPDEGASVPIGRPITNTRVWLLDPWGEPVPAGVPGHLHLGGTCLGRGYVGRPELTAASYVPDPFGPAGSRLYRTGDLARWRPDGQLEYLGRIDHQVKVRGFRIELGEIEAALCRLPQVRDAVVLVREHGPGDRRLLACAVLRQGVEPDASPLQEALRASLPEYMVPAAFAFFPGFPVNTSGKVDRRALARVAVTPDLTPAESEAPRGPVEELLAGIWAEVLRVETVGREDDFFALGGHSLLATQVVSRIRQAFGVEVPLQRLFEVPTVAALAEALQGGREAAPPLSRIQRDRDLPLSFAQQRLWFLDQLNPGGTAYNVPVAVRLEGDLDVAVLRRAMGEVVRRHEVLRTTFAVRGGEPVQVIAPGLDLPVPLADLAALPEGARMAEARRLARREARRPFDMTAGPLMRASLLTLGEREHLALVSFHHIVADGWSMGVFLDELAASYTAFLRGEPSPLPPLPVQYADFAHWQRQYLQGEVLAEQLAWWRGQLADAPAGIELATDRPRSAVRTSRAGEVALELGAGLAGRLRALARGERATLFMVLFAAWNGLLARVSGQEDLVVGVPVAGRNRREIERLIGFFVNTLALRTRLEGDPSWRELTGRVRQATLGASTHQDLPFESVVAELRPDRAQSANPLFQVLFVLQNAPRGERTVPGLTLSAPPSAGTTGGGEAKLDLTLSLMESEEGLRGSLEYRAELFDATTAARLLQHFRVLLEGMVDGPEQRLSQWELLTDAERHQVLAEWNDTEGPDPGHCLHELFAAQARRSPGAVAVRAADGELTYGELEARAGRLARRLRALGVGPEMAVGVALERSVRLAEALLAVLALGAAYVPLDPSYPAERLRHMAEDSGLRLALAGAAASRLPELPGVRVLPMSVLDQMEEERLDLPAVSPDNLAYVIFTSGSTGRPKGVAVPHRGVVRLVRGAGYADLGPEQVFLQLTPVAFDVSTLEIWGTLLNGGRLVVPPVGRLSLEDMGRLIEQSGATSAWLTSGLFHQMVDGQLAALRPLKQLFAGGDVLSPSHVRRVVESLPDLAMINGYGPTENTTFTTCHTVRGLDASVETVPIGRPITGTRVFLLDRWLAPVPAGVIGELYAAGPGLARGYVGRPDLTAERFVPRPRLPGSVGEPGERMYRTGDLARFRPDGTIEFLGRRDHQVKVRGFRIELAEVEAALARCPGVCDGIVGTREDTPGDKRLVAYVTVAPGGPGSAELRAALRQELPDYMVPSSFFFLDEMPLNPNGKVDRRALARLAPEPPAERTTGGASASDPVEELLAAIWAEVLHRDEVGREEDFFLIGGHSLLATQVISRVREAFRVELPLQRLFDTPTVKGLAEAVREGLRAPVPPVVPVPREGGLPLSFAQERLWFLDQLQPGSAAYNVPAAVRLTGNLDVVLLIASAREVVRRHESLRTTFEDRGGEPVQVIAPELALAVPLVDLGALPAEAREAEARRLASAEARRPFDLQTGPLVRVSLLRLGEREHAALVVFHHIVSDGWSMGVFLSELAGLYRGSPLPPLPVQYADFAHWQRRWLAGEVLEAELASWRERLAGAPRTLELPTDRPRPAVPALRGRQLAVAVPPELTEALVRLGRREGVTPFMTLLALFQTLLGRLAGSGEVPVGTPIAGRNRREIEGLIGFFVNTLVLSTDLSGGPDVRELLRRAREVSLHGYAHQDLPFERLVEELQPERDFSRNPLFQVMFALQNAPFTALDLPALRLEPIEAESGTAKFDLTLSLREQGGGLRGVLEYGTALFDAATPERWWRSFLVLLAAAVEDPERRVASLPLLDARERQQLLVEWNDGGVATWGDRVLPELLAAQAARTPDAVALVCGDERVSYAELERSAVRLAHALRRLGVGPEDIVALHLERGLELITAMLATLKAGGAYLPLDPALPAERRKFLLEDSKARVVLTRDPAAVNASGPVLSLEPGWEDRLPEPEGLLPSGLLPAHPAYVIYTSGSTGQPKGVVIPHSALVNHMLWMQESLPLTPEDRVLQKTPAHFDASVWEIWAPLLAGARLVLARPDGHRDPDYLVVALREHGITVLQVVPTLLRALLEQEGLDQCRTLRRLCAGGEALTADLRDGFFALGLDAELVNFYGPTEVTIDSVWTRVGREGAVPIGRPVANTRVWLLDAWGEPVPTGVAGHLHLGGTSLGRGYVGRPDLTAASYVPDPFGPAGSRLYRTGDLARWRPDGLLEYLGRIDHQVKIRGFRIELGEIEAALRRLPQVREAAVLVREHGPGDKRLAAFVAMPPEGPGPAELRAALAETLPEALVPSSFLRLDSLPINTSGKVDRQALARLTPEANDLEGIGESLAPRDTLEMQLAGLWEELLGVGPVGVRDDFFALGGHSLLAVRLVARVRERLGRTIPLNTFLQKSTVEELAAELRRGDGAARRQALVPIRTEGEGAPLFLVHPVGGNVLCYAGLARQLGQPVYGLQVPDGEAPETLEEMAARYIEAIRAVRPSGPWRLGGWSMGGVVAFEMARQLAEAGEEVSLLALIDAFPRGISPAADGGVEEADDREIAALFVRDLEGLLGVPLPLSLEELSGLAPEEALRKVLAEVRRSGLQPPDLGEAELWALFETFRANARLLWRHEPRPYPGRAVLFRAAEWAAASDPSLGWSRLALGGVESFELPGSHYTLLQGAGLVARLRGEERPS
jgi:amino acid adenylation domain-containing protein